MHYFRQFFKKIKNLPLNFRAFGEATRVIGNLLRKFDNFQRFLKKITKSALLKPIFQQKCKYTALTFRQFGRKIQIGGKF